MFKNLFKINSKSLPSTLASTHRYGLFSCLLFLFLFINLYAGTEKLSLKDLSLGLHDLSRVEIADVANFAQDLLSDSSDGQSPLAVGDREKSKEEIYSTELLRLKKYEAQIQERVRSLDTILSEVDKLENGSADKWADGSENTVVKTPRGYRFGLGGPERSKAPMIHFQGSPSKAKLPTEAKGANGEEKISLLLNELDTRMSKLSSIPLGAPVITDITSGFGYRSSPFSSRSHFHTGVDFSLEPMTPVVATADGFVVNAGPKGAYGNAVIIQHQGNFETLYGHLAKVGVKPGEKVCRGERIGWVGNSGRSTGPHLHYEVRKYGAPRDPVPYIELASFTSLLNETDEES